jgi:carbamate kinase
VVTGSASKPLAVVALGGNAISPPTGALSYGEERLAVRDAARELAEIEAAGYRLLVVHGNGPQVGRLLRRAFDPSDLDIHVAQTQGELGYLLVAALAEVCSEPAVAVVTRCVVDGADPALAAPDKPVGPVLREHPGGDAVWLAPANGWRRVVPSPRPMAVPERPQIGALLEHAHVVAGGGGGVPQRGDGTPVPSVVDKDRLAALLALELGAEALLFATNVEGAYRAFGTAQQALIERMGIADARAALDEGVFAAGSMGPKVEAAVAFAAATGKAARITRVGTLRASLEGRVGTVLLPTEQS